MSGSGVRFAPSPTGRFHVGNLRTAWISHLWARTLNTPWVVRFEDIDQPRVLPGAQEQQLEDLLRLGLSPNAILIQSHSRARHWQALIDAISSGQVYPCDCSRKEVQEELRQLASAPHEAPPVYSGRCRAHGLPAREIQAAESLAWRFSMPHPSGRDDFIVARSSPQLDARGLPEESSFVPAYHWACAIDDFDGDYQLLVRSTDLKPAALPQRAVQSWLAVRGSFPERHPALFHTSLVTQNDGRRLEKRTRGVTLPELSEAGITSESLLAAFTASFSFSLHKSVVTPGALLEESPAELSLKNLGL